MRPIDGARIPATAPAADESRTLLRRDLVSQRKAKTAEAGAFAATTGMMHRRARGLPVLVLLALAAVLLLDAHCFVEGQPAQRPDTSHDTAMYDAGDHL